MPTISCQNQSVIARDDEEVLDACLRAGIAIPFSCRDGVCHSCLCVAVTGNIPTAAQRGLSQTQIEQAMFLPCRCVATEDMGILPAKAVKLFTETMLQGKEMLSSDLCKLLLEPTLSTACEQGEFVNLRAPDQSMQSFRIVNQPTEEYLIEVHVPRNAHDSVSEWVFEQLQVDQVLTIQGPFDTQQPAVQAADAAPRAKYPPPDPVLWAALQGGKLMAVILQDFYSRVYQDPLLSPYFHGTTMQRSIEKVYSFMQRVCSGADSFFGEQPRNAHHWMVISDEIYRHRSALMLSCHQRAGLSAEMSERWFAIEDYYKQDIVKAAAIPRHFAGRELPLEGYGDMVLDAGSMCDGCGRVIEVGEHVRYHVRLGTLYCTDCKGGIH